MPSTSRRRLLLVAVAFTAQAGAVAFGAWMLDDLGRRYDTAARHRVERMDAMTDLYQALTDTDRMALMAVFDGDRLHLDVPVAFRACIRKAREACRAGRAGTDFAGEDTEAASLASWVEAASRRGDALLASPAGGRKSLYHEPATGFQSAILSAWRHMSKVRILNEVLLEEAGAAARAASRHAAYQFGVVASLSVVVNVLAWWRWRRLFAGAGQEAKAPVSVVVADGRRGLRRHSRQRRDLVL